MDNWSVGVLVVLAVVVVVLALYELDCWLSDRQ